ncbi:hypothetical protein LIER_18012 [Lithospermum erythrorhizon]|uniref:Gag-pol polyprotein n=1 Tax=Lithospermum erythrorhizon TaxID=34254 RepID=A0AAV3QE63_LITER
MEGNREGSSITRPPRLDGSNYPYWKAKMTAFLRSVDTITWKAVLIGWTEPTEANEEGILVVKEEQNWTNVEALGNCKALNAIFCVVSPEVFILISSCTVAKEAWEILQTTYEGTLKVRMSRL